MADMYELIMDDGRSFIFEHPLEAAEKAVELLGRPRFITNPGRVYIEAHQLRADSYFDMRGYFEPGAFGTAQGFKVYRSEWASIEGFGPCGMIKRCA